MALTLSLPQVHDGKKASNTFNMDTELGWKGLCVDPVMHNMEGRTCTQIRKAIVGTGGGGQMDFSTDGSELGGLTASATDAVENQMWSEKVKRMPVKKVDVVDVATLLADAGAPKVVDYMSLDVEGLELEILQNFPHATHCVRTLTVEVNEDPARVEKVKAVLASHGYAFMGALGVDLSFRRDCE